MVQLEKFSVVFCLQVFVKGRKREVYALAVEATMHAQSDFGVSCQLIHRRCRPDTLERSSKQRLQAESQLEKEDIMWGKIFLYILFSPLIIIVKVVKRQGRS